MNEEQANDVIDLLSSISDKLDSITRRLSNIESNTNNLNLDGYNLDDLCTRIDEFISSVKNIE